MSFLAKCPEGCPHLEPNCEFTGDGKGGLAVIVG